MDTCLRGTQCSPPRLAYGSGPLVGQGQRGRAWRPAPHHLLPLEPRLRRDFRAHTCASPNLAITKHCSWSVGHSYSRNNPKSALSWGPPYTLTLLRAVGGARLRDGPCSAPSSSGQGQSLCTLPGGFLGQWGWRHLRCRSYLEGTGDGNGTFLNPVITSQERLRHRGPSQARMRPLALQTAAQSAPSADCHWPGCTGSPGRLSGLRDRRWGQREGVRGRWHSEVGGSCCSAGRSGHLGGNYAWTTWPAQPLSRTP